MSKNFFFPLMAILLGCSNSFAVKDEPTEIFNQNEAQNSAEYDVINDLPIWEKTSAELQTAFEKVIATANAKLNKIASIADEKLTFKNTLEALDTIYYQVDLVGNRVGLLAATSTDKSVREKATELETAFSKWYVDVEARKDIYLKVKSYADNRSEKLNSIQLKYLSETLRSYKRAGFDLSEASQKKAVALKKELSELTTKIDENIKKAGANKIIFTKEEMKGMPESALSQLDKKGETYVAKAGVTYQVYAVLENSPIEAIRKKVMTLRNQRALNENKKLTEEVVRKRAQLANVLGYKTWADYKTEIKMAKTGKTALDFVDGLISGLEPKLAAELAELTKLKIKETKNPNAVINSWDIRYYKKKYEKASFDLDKDSLKKYFEYRNTLKGMFALFEGLFKLKVEFVKAPYVWASDVELVKISDAVTGKPLGFLYLDMFPRPDQEKYGHFAMFTIRSGKVLANGKYRRPVASLVCNFPRAKDGKPSLLTFDHVETLFHEFGHALHGIITESPLASFAGTRVARDFVEAPSQMLEAWVNDKDVLDTFAKNYKDPSDKFPALALDKIEKATLATIGLHYRRQLAFGKMDLVLHQNIGPTQEFDIEKVTNQILKEVYFEFPEKTAMINSFGHLWGGYDAGYYGYAWADSLSADMTSLFESAPDGFLDVETGMRLRREIYEVGSTRDINTSIEKFLGRPSNNKAFLKKLGI